MFGPGANRGAHPPGAVPVLKNVTSFLSCGIFYILHDYPSDENPLLSGTPPFSGIFIQLL